MSSFWRSKSVHDVSHLIHPFKVVGSDFIKKYELNLKRNIRNRGVFGRKGVRRTDARKRLFLLVRRSRRRRREKQARLSGNFKFFFSACERRVEYYFIIFILINHISYTSFFANYNCSIPCVKT